MSAVVTDRSIRPLLARALEAFPRGGLLPAANWRRRHLALGIVLLWHFPVLLAYGLFRGYPFWHAAVDASLPLAFGVVAFLPRLARGARSVAVATGLISCSVMLVHQSHGLIEAHFHFFVMVAVLTLYQDWKPFLVAIGLTVLEHGVTGVLAPHSVYNHADAWAHPWRWAFIHGAFVVAASAASIAAWSMSEADHRRLKADTARLHAQRVELLSHAAHHDALTGLPNRRMVQEHLESAAARSTRSGTLLGVMFIDLDRFKSINDTYGHVIGDMVLKTTADRLRSTVRGSDVASRLGGDEFVIVYEGLQDHAALQCAMDRVSRALEPAI
ncbi:MAG: GGDEF domain-containing protein, partial [Actinomycetota bacterium]|nr:GGDEF domain-containing protein [Actinomycetota bacterium]